MNRRVVLTVTDQGGRLIKEGGMNDILKALQAIQDSLKKQEECCAQILKRLDKLDDILASLKNLQGENDKLADQLNDLRNQHNALRDQVAGLPKPLTSSETQTIAHTEALGAVDEAQKRNKKFALLGMNIGPTFGPNRTGDFTFSGAARFFSPFGGDGQRAVQAQGEFMYYPGRKEGQFDIGLVNRFGKHVQAGAFGSFKFLEMGQYQSGGSMAQAAFLLDYVFNGGRIGAFVTRGFKNYAILNNVVLAPGAYLQTYARVVNQQGINFQFGVWGNAAIEGNAAYLKMREAGRDARPGFNVKLVQPLSEHVAFTVGGSYNETLVSSAGSGSLTVGLQVGNFPRVKEYGDITHPVAMDVPRVRYEFGTRRTGNSPPVVDVGPSQMTAQPGTVTLNGCGSYDPLGLGLTYQWQQISGPTVTLSSSTVCNPSFTAVAGQTYAFRLTIRNTDGLQASGTVTVTTVSPTAARIVQFTAIPASIQPGQASTLTWVIDNATAATITPGVGNIDPKTGSVSVSPTQTTTYTLAATGPSGTINSTVTVSVGAPGTGNPQILRFESNPVTITAGQNATLSWATNGAATASISGVGNVPVNGSTTVSPTSTTTYTLTATSQDGRAVTAPVTVIVSAGQVPQVVTFVANPQTIDAGQSTKLCWQITNATNITITPGVGSNLNANDCADVRPTQTTTYTLTATNGSGQIQANVTVNVGQVRILSFTSDPQYSLAAGAPVTLGWTTQNASSVVIVGNELQPQSLPASGSLVVKPITNTTYTLTAYAPGGQTVSVTISVFVR